MICLGIDPGLHGSLAIIDGESVSVVEFDKEAYLDNLRAVAESGEVVKCCLEHVSSMPKQGVSSTFTFGTNFGWIQGVLEAYKIPFELVKPRKWKADFGCTSDKNTSIEVCKRLFPNVSLKRTPKCKKDDDGMAEALLMALYAKRHF